MAWRQLLGLVTREFSGLTFHWEKGFLGSGKIYKELGRPGSAPHPEGCLGHAGITLKGVGKRVRRDSAPSFSNNGTDAIFLCWCDWAHGGTPPTLGTNDRGAARTAKGPPLPGSRRAESLRQLPPRAAEPLSRCLRSQGQRHRTSGTSIPGANKGSWSCQNPGMGVRGHTREQ